MSVIYSYPIKGTPVGDDLILISDSASSPQFATKQVKVSTLPFTNNAGTVTSVGIAVPAAFEASAAITTSGTITIGVTGGNAGQYLAHDGTWGTPAGGAANPAGAVTQIQYHDTGGVFGASTNLSFSTGRLTVANMVDIKGDGSSNAGKLKLYCQDNSTPHYVELIGPAHSGSPVSYSITLPNKIATQSAVSGGRVLEVDASGVGNWITTPTGSGGSYQAGNGIDIDTSTNPDTLKTGLAANGGLIFDTAKMKVDLAATSMSGELRPVDGGTGLSSYSVGDLIYAETTTTLGALNVGTNDKILGVNNGGTAPQWITNLVGPEVVSGYMLIGNGTSAMTQLDTTAKGTIAVGNGTTTTTKGVGTDGYVLTAKSGDATGVNWEAITFPTVNLASGVTGTLPVGNGGTGLASISASAIPRGSGTSAMVADSYLTYNASTKSLVVRGTNNSAPTMNCTLSIRDAQGASSPVSKIACIGLEPAGTQGAKAMHIDLAAYNQGIEIVRGASTANNAMLFKRLDSLIGAGTGASTIGNIAMTNTTTAYNTTSDYRLKENVVDMTGSVDRVKQLKPSKFNFIGDAATVDGFLAHEAQAIVPESVTGTKDEVDADGNAVYQGIDQAKLVPLLVGAIKELTARIEALEA